MAESEIALFEQLANTTPPENPPVLIDRAGVLGGSIAGLFAARVLADHARQVVVIEQDDLSAGPRRGVPHCVQYHGLLPAGGLWADRWLSGFFSGATDRGAVLAPSRALQYYSDGLLETPSDMGLTLLATRPFVEARVREKVLALPNVSIVRGRATGLAYRDDRVSGVRYLENDATQLLPVDFVVDAMGRASRLPDWLAADGFDRPPLERVRSGVNYATARFRRRTRQEELDALFVSTYFSNPELMEGLSVAAVSAVEDDQWLLGFVGYDEARPGRTVGSMKELAAKLPPPFAEAVAEEVLGDVISFYHADNRRRDFTAAAHFPARLASVGDAVASFNPAFAQGISSAALHASCLSRYLRARPDLDTAAAEFFHSQKVVVDAAWALSADGDLQRQETLEGAVAAPDVQARRAVMANVIAAATVDPAVSTAFRRVTAMLAHPDTLAAPDIQARAVLANAR